MKIIVPSLGRAGTAASMKWLPDSGRPITFAIHADEIDAYRMAYPGAHTLVVPDNLRHHIGKIRRFIFDTVNEPFFWVDDDIRIYLKEVGSVVGLFDLLEEHLKSGVAMAGVGQQLYCNMQKTEQVGNDLVAIRNKFVSICYAVNPKFFKDCKMEELCIYDDVAIVIHAIQQAGTIVTYAATQANLTPSKGGCNSWRTKEIIIEDLKKIVEMYPDICSIRDTTNTTHSQYIGIGLRTAWSKIKKLPLADRIDG